LKPIKIKVEKTRVSSKMLLPPCLKFILAAFYGHLEDFCLDEISVEQLMSKLTQSHVGPGGKLSHQCHGCPCS
jgi:hypothetical protein